MSKEQIAEALQNGHITITYIDVSSIVNTLLTISLITITLYGIYKLIEVDKNED